MEVKKKRKKKIIQKTLEGEFVRTWESAAEASRELYYDASTITKCLKGKIKTAGGFLWEYKD